MFDMFSNTLSSLFNRISGSKTITDKNIADTCTAIQEALRGADVPFDLIEQFIQSIKQDVLGKKVMGSLKPGDQFIKVVYDALLQFLGGQDQSPFSFQLPSVVMV